MFGAYDILLGTLIDTVYLDVLINPSVLTREIKFFKTPFFGSDIF